MPESRRRKKDGKFVGNGEAKNRAARLERAGEQESGVSLQDLINVLAYQEYVKDGTIVPQQPGPDTIEIDFDDPDNQAIIRAVDNASITEGTIPAPKEQN